MRAMEARPESQAHAQQQQAGVPVPPNVAGSTAEAVERILASTEAAVAAVRGRAERQVRMLASDVEARAAEEAMERRRHLEQLRQDLARRAASLSVAYQAINEQLAAVDTVLGRWSGSASFGAPPQDEHASASVEAIKMTLRERQRITVPYQETVTPATEEDAQLTSRFAAVGVSQPRRRWWRPWQREAA